MLARRHNARLKPEKGLFARVDTVAIGARRVVLAVPTTYMNESGMAVAPMIRRFDIAPEQLIVLHDELDLAPGVLRLKAGGGLAGNNGLRSIKAHARTDAFLRVRLGIGKPISKERGADHVLDRFSKRERDVIEVTLARAADAVEAITADGIDAAMNVFNAT